MNFGLVIDVPFISVIIPTFNSSNTIKRCLDSILYQEFVNFEVIIIDNCSSDFTIKIITDSFTEIQYKLTIVKEKDNSVYEAMNKGIIMAKGVWIYFMGSDDWIFNKNVFSTIFPFLAKSRLNVVYGNVLIHGNTSWANDGDIYAGKFSKNRMLFKSICHQSIFYRRDFLIQNNLFFDLHYPVSSDWHLNLRCRRLTNFKYVNLIIAVFSAGGISSTKKDSFPEQIKSEFKDLYPSRAEVIFKEISKSILRIFK